VKSQSSEKSNAIANSYKPDLLKIDISQALADITKLKTKDQNEISQFDFNSNKDLKLEMENSLSQVIKGDTFNENSQINFDMNQFSKLENKFELPIKSQKGMDDKWNVLPLDIQSNVDDISSPIVQFP